MAWKTSGSSRRGILVAALIVLVAYVTSINVDAWRRGFLTKPQMERALALGLATRQELWDHDKRARTRAEDAKAAGAKAAADAVRLAAETCHRDIVCWAEKYAASAAAACAPRIERLAVYQHEWTAGLGGARFSSAKWHDQLATQVSFFGDKVKFQNGFGAWQRHTYRCDFDPVSGRVLGVEAWPGRLPP